jgi:putative DNA primase/helicase
MKTYRRPDPANFKNIPAELTALPQWECWKLVEGRKVPINVLTGKRYPKNAREGASENMATATFDDALTCFLKDPSLAGIGFRFKRGDPYCGVDIDDSRNAHKEGDLLPFAEEIVKDFNTYTEVSPSGTGVKMICRGKIPAGALLRAHRRELEWLGDPAGSGTTRSSLRDAFRRKRAAR